MFKSTTLIKYLGIMCDSAEGKFYVLSDKVDKLVALIATVLEEGKLTFKVLEKIVGKCRSMSIAVPCAICIQGPSIILGKILQPYSS